MQHHELEQHSSVISHFAFIQLNFFSAADSLDREDSLSDEEQCQAATSISEAYGLLTPSVKVRAHFKIFHHWKSLPTCNSMKHSEAYRSLTLSVKVRAGFKTFHPWKSLPTCNSMKHCILTCK